MSIFDVQLRRLVDDSYEIEIGFDLVEKLTEDLKSGLAGKIKRFVLITDDNVDKFYAEPVFSAIEKEGYEIKKFVIPAGEKSKTREMKAWLEDEMLAAGFKRDCMVIAVGGGVVTDLAGFVAGTFGRGVPFINYATTILAAADASVGGKTAVDTPLATNLIGIFNQPQKVYIDIACWKTLPERQVSSGMAETVKQACLADKKFFEYLEENMESILAGNTDNCIHIAEENCRIKYEIVMKDEKEAGLREVLNLGHTVGRAIETLSDYRLLHGEAVSIGMVAECALAKYLGYMTDEEEERVVKLLSRAKLPVTIPAYIDRKALVKKLYTDKKVRNGKLRFVVQKGIGEIVEYEEGVFAIPIEEALAEKIIMAMK